MKNLSLTIKIWLLISCTLLAISILLMIFFPVTLRHFFTNEIYTTIENEQVILRDFGFQQEMHQHPLLGNMEIDRNRSVQHIIILEHNHLLLAPQNLSIEFMMEARANALNQESAVARYAKDVDDRTMFYVIRKAQIYNQPAFLLSYAWDSYRNDLMYTLYNQLLMVMAVAFLLSWIPSIWFARYLSRPIITLERHVKKIADREWHEPIQIKQRDEIGKLATSIEKMRTRLMEKEEAQQSLLQHISHDLKTPVMVIQSYAQSISDGIYPKGSMEESISVVQEESERLEKKIRDLLYLTKLEYLSSHQPPGEEIELKTLIHHLEERLKWTRPELEWHIQVEESTIQGEYEQWYKAFENILDNQIRYAQQQIIISSSITRATKTGHITIRIWNDGEAIDEQIAQKLFQKFQKGNKGEFGLGLAIVKRILDRHHAFIWATNEENGVAFYLKIPM